MSVRDSRTLEIAIESARKEAQDLTNENQARLAQLITVWICGYLEVSCRDVLLTYAERKSNASVARFVRQRLRRIRSPDTAEILNLVRSFDKDRAAELDDFVRGRIEESVNSVVQLRNRIAHGQPEDAPTIARVEAQFDDSRKLATKMKELFDDAA